jgi:hypothetical protein
VGREAAPGPWHDALGGRRMEATDTGPAAVVSTPGRPRAAGSVYSILGAIALCALAPGCTYHRLQINTAKQAQTVIDLQYQQVLDNLAMFYLNRAALPSLVTLKTGASQVGDTGTLGFLGVTGNKGTFGNSPTIAGTRTIVDQWSSSPVTDDNNLLLLSKAFQSALGDHQWISEDDANDLAHDLSAQIGTTSDISVDRDTLNSIINPSVLSGVLARLTTPDRVRRNPPPGTPEADDLRKEEDAELRTLGQRLAKVNEAINSGVTSTLDEKILVESYVFPDGDRLAVRLMPVVNANDDIPEQGKDLVNLVIVAKVGQALHFGYDLRLMSWGDGSGVPTSGTNLVIVGTDHNGLLHIRIFDATGKNVMDTDETKLPATQAGAILTFKQRLPGLSPPLVLTDAEKAQLIREATSIAGQTLHFRIFDGDGVKVVDKDEGELREQAQQVEDLKKQLEILWPPHELTRSDKDRIIIKVGSIFGATTRLRRHFVPAEESATGLAKETIYRINDVQKTIDEIHPGWLRWGPEKPKDACYAGHACFCGQECYVWVCPDGLEELSKFTRAVLKIGTTFKDVQVVTAPSGIQFAPALTNTPR